MLDHKRNPYNFEAQMIIGLVYGSFFKQLRFVILNVECGK